MSREKISEVFKADPVIYNLLKKFGVPERSFEADVFNALIRSIVGQQLSIKVAQTIYDRFAGLFPGKITPEKIIKMDFEKLRKVGLSNQKTSYIKNVAVFFKENDLIRHDWTVMSDVEVIDLLTQIKGVGIWTAQMLLMFTLDRPDVFPVGDLGIRLGMKEMYQLDLEGKDLIKQLEEISIAWQPYRSVGSKLIWLGKDSA